MKTKKERNSLNEDKIQEQKLQELNDKELENVSGGIIENISQSKPEQASGGLTGQPIFNGDGQRRGTNEQPLGNKIETFN